MGFYKYEAGVGEFSDGDLSKLLAAATRLNLTPSQMVDWIENVSAASTAPEVPLSAAEHAFFAASSGLTEGAETSLVETPAQQRARLLRASLTTKDVGERLGVGPDAIRHRIGKKQLWSFVVAGQHRIPIWQFVANGTSRSVESAFRRQDAVRPGLPALRSLGSVPDWEPVAIRTAEEWFGNIEDAGPFYVRVLMQDAEGNVVRESEEAPLIADTWTALPGLEMVVPAIPDGTMPVSLEGFMNTPQDELLVGGHPWTPRRWLTEGQDPRPVAELVADLGTIW